MYWDLIITQEDSFFIQGAFAGNPEHDVIGLFDGHGGNLNSKLFNNKIGAEVANFAAANFPKIIEKKLKKMDPIDTLKGAIQTMNKQLKKNFEGMIQKLEQLTFREENWFY